MKPGRTPSHPPPVNTPTVRYSDVNSVSKSDLPRPSAPFHKPLTAKDVTSPAFIEKVVEILNGDNDKTEVIESLPAAATNKTPNPPLPDKAPITPLLPNPPLPDKAPNTPLLPNPPLLHKAQNAPLLPNPLLPDKTPNTPSFENLNQLNSMFAPPSMNGAPIRPNPSLIVDVLPPTMLNEAPKQPNIPMLPQATSTGEGLFVLSIFDIL